MYSPPNNYEKNKKMCICSFIKIEIHTPQFPQNPIIKTKIVVGHSSYFLMVARIVNQCFMSRNSFSFSLNIHFQNYFVFFSAASRGSAIAQLYNHFINYAAKYHRTPSGKALEIIAKSIQKRRRINETTSLERWR